MTLQAGARLGVYRINDLIGRGGMGEVYRARDTRLGRSVALKVLSPELAGNAEHFARFDREARTGALLDHPNIPAVYDIGSYDGRPFVVSELLHGSTLRVRMNGGPLDEEVAADYARQVARGLIAAHEMEIVHRDLKPENIFVTRGGQVKILDFGLAKSRQRAIELVGRGGTIRPGTPLGTLGYLSPEQVRGEAADPRSDIFSLGVILYEMVTGGLPFQGRSPIEILNAILNDEPRAIASGGRAVDPDIESAIRHCLEKNPGSRFQTARDLSSSLESIGPATQPDRLRSPWTRYRLLQTMMRMF
jgi:eukaryotic-like serine/threonine-protein kinase